MKGYLTKSKYAHDIQLIKMNNCFEYFSEIQTRMETNAIRVIVYYMRKFTALRAVQRKKEEEEY